MLDVSAIQSKLKNDPDLILKVLESLEYEPKDCGTYFNFANHDGDNKTACVVYKDTLVYHNYTRTNRNGNLFTLIMYDRSCNFKEAVIYVANQIGYNYQEENSVQLPFGGFFKRIHSQSDGRHIPVPTYPSEVFRQYEHKYNVKFFNDGVDYLTQQTFNLGYNTESNAILIPIYTPSGQLCGIKARNNDPQCDSSHRWWAQLPFPKTAVLYGYHINYMSIVQSGTAVLVEAEKSVMQSYSFGFKNTLAVLGHNISKEQVRLIKSLQLKKIIVAFDEGIAESDILYEALKLEGEDVQVGYIFDRHHDVLRKGSKDSPCDVGIKGFKELLSEHTTWIKKEDFGQSPITKVTGLQKQV